MIGLCIRVLKSVQKFFFFWRNLCLQSCLVLRPLQSGLNSYLIYNCPCQRHRWLLVNQSIGQWILFFQLTSLKPSALLSTDPQKNMVGNHERMCPHNTLFLGGLLPLQGIRGGLSQCSVFDSTLFWHTNFSERELI